MPETTTKTPPLPGKVFSQEELLEMAQVELNEDPRTRDADLKNIKSWLKKQPHLDKYVIQDDQFLLGFLRGCKFSLEQAKKKLDTFFTVRALCPEFFSGWDVKDRVNMEIIQSGLSVILPGYDKHGRKVIINRGGRIDPAKGHSQEDAFRVTNMINACTLMRFDDLQTAVCGAVVINDSHGTTMAHLAQFTPALGKKMMTIFEEAYPGRPKGLHFMNMPSFVTTIFNLMRSFMKDKMRERLIMHPRDDDFSLLHEHVGTEVLPEEYGGSNGTMQQHVDDLTNFMLKNRDWLIKQTQFKANEKKRKGKEKTHSDVFGMEGSFRQLSFD